VKNNDEEQLFQLFDLVEQQVASVVWSILGWWKATSVEDACLMVRKGHIVSMVPTGAKHLLTTALTKNRTSSMLNFNF
jgi:hypothetical protein